MICVHLCVAYLKPKMKCRNCLCQLQMQSYGEVYPPVGNKGMGNQGQVQYLKNRKLHQCPVCSYSTPLRSNLVIHHRTHTGEKPFACNFCPYVSVSKSDLVKHIRTHTGEKPYSCPKCPYQTAISCNLKKHMSIHLKV